MHRATGKKGFIDIDVEGYRSRRESTLKAQALDLARRAREEGNVLSFDPMSARERRIVHMALAEEPGVCTESEGYGDHRYVQVIPDPEQDD
jgi:spoIIIJ-associated protein